MKIVKKIKKIIFSDIKLYKRLLTKPIDDKGILLEAGQGKNINGNMFAFLKAIEQEKEWEAYIPYFVVTNETIDDAKERCRNYHFTKVRFVIRNSKEYKKRLAVSKYLITDNSFPPYFYKREEQIYLNTWHGTPLKYLGRSDIRNSVSIGNVQKNYFNCDYALFPNEHTRDVFMKDYMLDRMFDGSILMADYPRNAALLDEKAAQELRRKLLLDDKELIAYMPTWRGTGRMADSETQIRIISEKLDKLDKRLKDSQLLYVNLHFLVSDALNFDHYTHIRPFPKEYETYEFLNICDTLITDYSSVFFDFAVTGRKIVLFAYDKEEYLRDKGMYLNMDEFPFSVVQTTDELIDAINADGSIPTNEFLDEYCRYTDKDIVNKILRLLMKHTKSDLEIQKPQRSGKKQKVYHIGNMTSPVLQNLMNYHLTDMDDDCELTLVFEKGISFKKALFLEKLPKDVYYYSVIKADLRNLWDFIFMNFYTRFGLFKNQAFQYVKLEKKRLFSGWNPDEVDVFLFNNFKYVYAFSQFDCEKKFHKLPYEFYGVRSFTNRFERIEKYGEENFQLVNYDDSYAISERLDVQKYSSAAKCILNRVNVKESARGLNIQMKVRAISFQPMDWTKIKVAVGNRVYTPDYRVKEKYNGRYYEWNGKISFEILYAHSKGQDVQNKMMLLDGTSETEIRKIRLFYGRIFRDITKLRFSRVYIDKKNELSYFFRFPKDTLTLTIRDENVTDLSKERVKVFAAWLLSKIVFWWKPVLLFEKNAARYEESASVTYEKLIDQGYNNAYFVLDKEYPFRKDIPKKYTKNIIDKYSFKHYLCFFLAKSFIGSEAKIHSFEVRPISKLVERRLRKTPHNYVFLQHGVMYMISLDSERRGFFKPVRNKKIVQKTVVSSVLEANHFIELGGHKEDSLILCGLPKFDRNEWHKDADKIVVMLTWRPWEYIQSLEDVEQTKYFQMLKKIVEQVPEEYREHLMVLPHPLVENQLRSDDNSLSKYIPPVIKYDDILKDTKILITDYSSISYDAFYRGCNVIFCWQEKDECLEEYGPTAKLMLTEELAFGDVNYDYEKLSDLIIRNYQKGQQKEYVDNYRQIVNFHDGHNTDRLIKRLKEDEII